MIQLGSAFLWKVSREEHPWFVISIPSADPGRVLAVNATDARNWLDHSCVIEAGEHSIISKRSCIRYDRAQLFTAEQLERFAEDGYIALAETVSPIVLNKLLDGAALTNRLPKELEELLRSQDLLL